MMYVYWNKYFVRTFKRSLNLNLRPLKIFLYSTIYRKANESISVTIKNWRKWIMSEFSPLFASSLFHFTCVSRYCRASVSSRPGQNRPDTNCLGQIDRHAWLRPKIPRKLEKTRKKAKSRAVTRRPTCVKVRLLVYIETPVNRIYLQVVHTRYNIHSHLWQTIACLHWKPFTSSDYIECLRNIS